MLGFLKNDFRPGDRNIPHAWLNTIANFFNEFNVVGGGLRKRSDGKWTTVYCNGGAGDSDFRAAFVVTDAEGSIGTMLPGKFFVEGAAVAIIGLPSTITATAHLETWIERNIVAGTLLWKEGTATPASAGTLWIYPVLEIFTEAAEIATVFHAHPADFHVAAAEGVTATFQVMGTLAEHPVGAGSDSWTAGGTSGLRIPYVDIGYDHTTGTPILYAYKREGTFSRFGRLVNVTTEAAVVIDQPISHALLGT